jgi:hypothetical protein
VEPAGRNKINVWVPKIPSESPTWSFHPERHTQEQSKLNTRLDADWTKREQSFTFSPDPLVEGPVLWVPKTSSTSRDQLIFMDESTEPISSE